MKSIQLTHAFKAVSSKKGNTNKGLIERYIAYANNQDKQSIYWYLKAIIIIPCVIMVPAIILMSMSTPHYEAFVGFCMIMFFTNIVLHMSEAKGKIFVPFYHITLALMVSIPSFAYLINV